MHALLPSRLNYLMKMAAVIDNFNACNPFDLTWVKSVSATQRSQDEKEEGQERKYLCPTVHPFKLTLPCEEM